MNIPHSSVCMLGTILHIRGSGVFNIGRKGLQVYAQFCPENTNSAVVCGELKIQESSSF